MGENPRENRGRGGGVSGGEPGGVTEWGNLGRRWGEERREPGEEPWKKLGGRGGGGDGARGLGK